MMQYKQRGQNPPDLTTAEGGTTISLWGLHYMQFWEVTMCQWQKRLDPAYNTYEVQNGNHIETFRLSIPAARTYPTPCAARIRSADQCYRKLCRTATEPVHPARQYH